MGNTRVVYLEMSTFAGIVGWAIHWYGKLWCGDDRIVLTCTLTAAQAKQRNRGDKWDTYREGSESERWDDEDALIARAMATWREHFPSAVLFVRGDHAYVDPMLALDGDPDLVRINNEFFHRAEKIGWYDGDEDAMDDLWEQWRPWWKTNVLGENHA